MLPESGSWFVAACTIYPRFVLGAAVVVALGFGALRTLTRGELRQGLMLGLFAFAGMILQNDGLQFTSASTSAFLTQLYVILIPAALALRLRRVPPWPVWVSGALVLAGVTVLARPDWRALRLGRGEWETMLCSLYFTGQILWLNRRRHAANRPLPVTAVMFLVVAAGGLALAFAAAPRAADVASLWTSPAWLGFTAALTLFCTIITYVIMNTWQPKITSTEAGLIYCIEPVFVSLLAMFLPAWFSAWGGVNYPNESAGASLLLGGGLITAANVLIQLRSSGLPEAP